MGCDIHMYAEIKKGGSWQKIEKIFNFPYYRPEEPSTVDADGFEWNSKLTDHPYFGRNYDLFAILADVRNGRGFAGIKTGEGFIPITEPKGLPDDVSYEVKRLSDEWGTDGHSHSWLTLHELQSYDWNQLTVNQGWVNERGYQEFKKYGMPNEYCGDVMGPNIIHLTNEQMESVPDGDHECYTLVRWGTTYKSAVGDYFFDTTIPALQALGTPHEVRIIFWFDN